MSKWEMKQVLAKELDDLNSRIDGKILAGKNFRREAIRHRRLLAYYRRLGRVLFFF